ncbi:succinate dehydrogenase iron-sulfur subunit [Agrococcus terreus]|uniref:Succinate dehydrogenase iron-sulfur subunit n=2 Tax=Agrococcus terreus TaxID=574649 RepID=A0ABQ2KR23_9MICO|nr:succinate dehydrogenase iron-sulfur subunit [Agrococcus terreus]
MSDDEKKNEDSKGFEGAAETGDPTAQADAAAEATTADAQSAMSSSGTSAEPAGSAAEAADRDVEPAPAAAAEPVEAPQSFPVTVIVRRYDPEVDDEPRWVDYDVQMYPTERILDALHRIKWEQDPSLAFRRSCAHGVCGSDAMRINGKNRLACKALVKDFDTSKPIYVEAIKGLPLEKDLIVNMEPFFDSFREIQPFLQATGKPEKERHQTIAQRERFDDTTKCILCAACTTSCPVFWTDGQYFGPAAIVNAHRFIFDSRDEASQVRLDILNDQEGVWRCRTTFNCTDACPRGIQVTKAIAEVKQAMMTGVKL